MGNIRRYIELKQRLLAQRSPERVLLVLGAITWGILTSPFLLYLGCPDLIFHETNQGLKTYYENTPHTAKF